MFSKTDDINFMDVINRMAGENLPDILRLVNLRLSEKGSELVAYVSEEGEVRVDLESGHMSIDLGVEFESGGEVPVWCVVRWEPEHDDNIGGTCVFMSLIVNDVIDKFIELVILEKNSREV